MTRSATEARPVVCLHGWTMRGAVFDDLAARLGPGFAVHAPDLPGHGAAVDAAPGLDACVARTAAAIAATERDDVLLLGWSMGAAVAWAYLGAHGPGRVAGLVTVDMSPKPVNDAAWSLGLSGQDTARLARTTREIRTDWPRAAEKIATTMFASRAGAPGFGRDRALTQVLSNEPAVMADCWEMLLDMDLRAEAAAVSCPWIVAHGARSRVYPAATAEWLAARPQARRVSFRYSGHSPHLEEPAAFADLLREVSAELA